MKPRYLWIALLAAAGDSVAAEINIPNALVKLIDQLDVPAREAGTVVQLHVQEGSRVKAEEVLARIDDTEARYAEEKAKVELQIATHAATSDVAVRSAERAREAADNELKRAAEARQKFRDVMTDTEFDKLRLASDQARLALEKAQQDRAALHLAQELKQVEAAFAARNVARRQAMVPFPGVVVQVNKHVGDWVQPGEKMLRVIRLDRLRVEAFLEASQLAPGLEGRPVALTVDLPGKPAAVFSGKLTFVSPEIDPFNRSVRVLADIENPGLLLSPGLRGTLVVK